MRPTRRQRVIPVRVHMPALPVKARTAVKPRLTGRTERTTDLEPVRRQPRPHRHAPRSQHIPGRVGVRFRSPPISTRSDERPWNTTLRSEIARCSDASTYRSRRPSIGSQIPYKLTTVSRRPAASLPTRRRTGQDDYTRNSPSTTCINSVGTSGTRSRSPVATTADAQRRRVFRTEPSLAP